jgi:hypothetical protein
MLREMSEATQTTQDVFGYAKIASGQASPNDRFVTFFWHAPKGEER